MIAIVCIAMPALAYDMTYVGDVVAKSTKTVKVTLPIGKSTVEVFSTTNDHKFNCQFGVDGRIHTEQQNVTKCLINPTVDSETKFDITIVNLEDKNLDYRIVIQDFVRK